MQHAPDILLIKTSSLGDVLHNLPVVTDIYRHFPRARMDWVVEESFAALPLLHPQIRCVIPVAMRRWRKSWWTARDEIGKVFHTLRDTPYDFALDTQGLIKSALITRCVNAEKFGYAWASAREPLASLCYQRTFNIAKNQHAVERNRQLAAAALGYPLDCAPDYGICVPDIVLPWLPSSPYVALLHATSRDDKLWQEAKWISLGTELAQRGYRAILPWGSEPERQRAERLTNLIPQAICAPRLDLNQAAVLLGKASAVIGVDTGLSHLAAALAVPTVGIYTSTELGLTGLYAGGNAINLGGVNNSPSVAEVIATLRELHLNGF